MTELKYPVLRISRDGTLHTAREPQTLESATDTAVKKGYFTNLSLLDAGGTMRKVRGAKIAQYVDPWRLFLSRRVRVALDLDPEEQHPGLDAGKELVLSTIDVFPHSWEAIDGSTEGIKKRVLAADSFEKLIRLFG